jgi:hypothetical protein
MTVLIQGPGLGRINPSDSFGRLRTSSPSSVFDSKQLFDKDPVFWAEKITDNSGNAASTHATVDAATTMHVELDDTIIRQTKTHWNYQPGKSQLVLQTGVLVDDVDAVGITARIGQFTAADGFFFEYTKAAGLGVVKRKASSDTRVNSADFNGDPMDGTGPSSRTFDPTKEYVFWMSYEWLSAGDLLFGVVIDNELVTLHTFKHFGVISSAFTSTPNLPLRYEISSTSGTAEMLHVCSTVTSEGGADHFGRVLSAALGPSTATITAATADVIYGIAAVRLKDTHLDATVTPLSVSLLSLSTNKDFEWFLAVNPTVAGDIGFADVDNSAVQFAPGIATNVVTGASWLIRFSGGYASANENIADELLFSPLHLGSDVDGVRDEVWLCARPLAVNVDFLAALSWQELS